MGVPPPRLTGQDTRAAECGSPGSGHFTRADASQLFLKAVVKEFRVRHIANILRRLF
jgi:hypothetical protein